MSTPTVSFTYLYEPNGNTTTTLPPTYDGNIALLLGACCQVTYQQYDTSVSPTASEISGCITSYLTTAQGQAVTLTITNVAVLTTSEANGPQSTVNNLGDYTTFPAGFMATFSQTGLASPTPPDFIAIVLRGTQSWAEWIDDADAYPAWFDDGNTGSGVDFVHGGYYGYYTIGTCGATVSPNPLGASRAAGSIAAQVQAYLTSFGSTNLPVYVTGHSLGGAVASLCAWDIAVNLASTIESVSMYSLASPRPIMGLSVTVGGFPITSPTSQTAGDYQTKVPASFRIVNACDIVPVLPPSTIIDNSTFLIQTAHVTDGQTDASGNPVANVVSFCAQTGDIASNHSCQSTYVPYLALMAPINQTVSAA